MRFVAQNNTSAQTNRESKEREREAEKKREKKEKFDEARYNKVNCYHPCRMIVLTPDGRTGTEIEAEGRVVTAPDENATKAIR